MRKPPKLIALDLDGTILDHRGVPSDRTIRAIQSVQSKGIEILFVTGRPKRWMWQVQENFKSGFAIISNGALLYNLETGQIVRKNLIPIKAQNALYERLAGIRNRIAIAIEWDEYFRRERSYHPRWDDGFDPVGTPKIEFVTNQEVHKILIRSTLEKHSPDEFLSEVSGLASGLVNVTYCNLNEPLLECSKLTVNKGTALAEYANSKEISREEVYAFGDNVNDFSMLEWAGKSWIMDGGHPDGKRVASFVAPRFESDGVAQILESFIQELI